MTVPEVLKELSEAKTIEELIQVVDRHPEYGHFQPDNKTFLEKAIGDKSPFPQEMAMEERIRWFVAFFAGKVFASTRKS